MTTPRQSDEEMVARALSAHRAKQTPESSLAVNEAIAARHNRLVKRERARRREEFWLRTIPKIGAYLLILGVGILIGSTVIDGLEKAAHDAANPQIEN